MTRREGRMAYIRNYYHVPAYRGRRVRVKKGNGSTSGREGVITGASISGAYVNVRLDGEKYGGLPYHPTDLEYLGTTSGALRVRLTVEADLLLRWAIADRLGGDRPASREQVTRYLDGEVTALLQQVRSEYDAREGSL